MENLSAPGAYLRLETKRRRSGGNHSVIVRFITFQGKIVIFPQSGSVQDWVLNIKSEPTVRLFYGNRIIEGRAWVRDIPRLDAPLLGAFQRKYGEDTVRARYWGQDVYVEVEPVRESTASDFNELVYSDLEAAFDGVAEDYDRHIFGNAINVWLRNRSIALLSRLFGSGDTILEVGCGTGTETIALARKGIRVLATDVSSKMLSVLERHAKDAGVQGLVVPIHARPYMLKDKVNELGYSGVDGAYSTYGAVNTDPRLPEFFMNLHSLMKPDGKLVLGVWNRYCLYEVLGYSLRGRPSMAGARFSNPVPVGKSRFCVSSNAYSPGSLSPLLKRYFTLQEVYGVGIFLPPSNLLRYLPPEPLLSAVKGLDVQLEGRFPWNRLGDHFLGVYAKND